MENLSGGFEEKKPKNTHTHEVIEFHNSIQDFAFTTLYQLQKSSCKNACSSNKFSYSTMISNTVTIVFGYGNLKYCKKSHSKKWTIDVKRWYSVPIFSRRGYFPSPKNRLKKSLSCQISCDMRPGKLKLSKTQNILSPE